MRHVYLKPGECFASREPTIITTLLGSCVGVALFDPIFKVGGLNHFLLPKGPEESHRYGEYSIPALIDLLISEGANPQSLQAKIYGGAAVLDNLLIGEGIGRQNIQVARDLLADYHIPLIAMDIGGTLGRKVSLNTKTFEVRCFSSSEMRRRAA
jgi:two-component system chemotaxis response regulator CheB